MCLLPWTFPLAAFALTTYFLLTDSKYVRPAIWAALFLIMISIPLMVLFMRDAGPVVWVVAVFSGSAMGVLYPSLYISSQLVSSAEPQPDDIKTAPAAEDLDPTTAVANFTFAQFLGQTVGVAFGFALFQNRFLHKLTHHHDFGLYTLQYVRDSVALATRVPHGDSESIATHMEDCYVQSLKSIWIFLSVFSGVALVMSAFMKKKEFMKTVIPDVKVVDEAYVV